MKVISIRSIDDAIRLGNLIELTTDYRTANSMRAWLPSETSCAISPAAFGELLQQGTAEERRGLIEAFCASLSHALNGGGKPAPPDFEFKHPGFGDRPASSRLKLQWFGPNQHCVVLLPDEQLRPLLQLR